MGNAISQISKISYEDIQKSLNDSNTIIINTIDSNNQQCLIKNTLKSDIEMKVINQMIKKRQFSGKYIRLWHASL